MLTNPFAAHRATTAPFSRVQPFARTIATAALLIIGAVASSHAQTQWVVDASGSGDFTDLQAAITHAAPGDVLRILPGNYAPAELTKSLSLIGNPDLPKPILASLDIQSAPTFSLQHLHLLLLRVVGGESRSVIDFCKIGLGGTWPAPWFETKSHFIVRSTPDLVLSSSEVIGSLISSGEDGFLAMDVGDNARVHIVQSTVRAQDTNYTEGWGPGFGADALRLQNNSEVWLTASTVRGGSGENGPLWAPGDGKAGFGVRLMSGSRLYARGRSEDSIRGGFPCGSAGCGSATSAIACAWNTTAVYSGISFVGDSGCAQNLGYNEPFLLGVGLGQVGSTKRVWFHGEAGVPAVLLIGLAPAALPLAGLEGTPLWVDPGQLLLALPGVTTGFTTPVVQTFPLPATSALAGLQVYLQGVQPVQQDLWRATNLLNFSLNW